MDICSEILISRRDAGLNQADLVGKAPGLTKEVIIGIESRRIVPSEEYGKAILDAIEKLKSKG